MVRTGSRRGSCVQTVAEGDVNMRFLLCIVSCVLLMSACNSPPSTQSRSVYQGSDEVHKVCTEKPPGYSSGTESRLKAELPLATEAQAEGTVKTFLDQQPKGTEQGEDLQSYLFYICQMANNGGWSEETTERLIRLFMERWPEGKRKAAPKQNTKCTERLESGYTVKEQIDGEYWQSQKAGTFQDRREELNSKWDRQAGVWAAETESVLLRIGGPVAKGRFQNSITPMGVFVNTDVKWNSIRNFLQGRLASLESICKEL